MIPYTSPGWPLPIQQIFKCEGNYLEVLKKDLEQYINKEPAGYFENVLFKGSIDFINHLKVGK